MDTSSCLSHAGRSDVRPAARACRARRSEAGRTTGVVMNSDYERRYRFLADRDPVLARLVEEYGHPDPFEWHDGGRTGSSNFAAMTAKQAHKERGPA
jgi:hypothetical protein